MKNTTKRKTTKKKVVKNSKTKYIKNKVKEIVNIKTPENKFNPKFLIFLLFITGVLLIFSSYAWLSTTLNVKVKFFDLVVSSDSGLFISLDAVNYSDAVELSSDSVVYDLKKTYPNHTNQWAMGGMWPVSSNGIKTPNNDKFDVYIGDVVKRKNQNKVYIKYLNTGIGPEEEPNAMNVYLAFDLFLKNVSGSPKPDNLYFDEGTSVDFAEGVDEEVKSNLSGVINSMRFGVVKIASTTSKADPIAVQNLTCNNNCQMVIYEPNSTSHSDWSILKAKENNITLVDGVHVPTYGVISKGSRLFMPNGQEGTGVPLDTAHFALQNTITDFEEPIFTLPNGVTKFRVYVWIEGQDVDSLESTSDGAQISIVLNFIKDLAGYDE